MTIAREGRDAPSASVVETASGTTSADNANSGNSAYLIALATLVVLAVIGSGISGCMSLAGGIIAASGPYVDGLDGYEWRIDELLDDEGLDYLRDDWDDGWDDGADGEGLSGSDSLSPESVLGTDLAMCNATIDSLLPASAYANAREPVRAYVRDLVLIDRDASADLADTLRQAAWGEVDLASSLSDARSRIAEAIEDIRALEAPTPEGDGAAEVSRNLEVGRGKALDKWRAAAEQLDLFEVDGDVDAGAVVSAENEISSLSAEAAESLHAALSASATAAIGL